MPNLSGRWKFWFPAPGSPLVPFEDNFSALAQGVADSLNDYGLPIAVANATERGQLFPSPSTGDRVYRKDLGYEEVYRGNRWTPLSTPLVGTANALVGTPDSTQGFITKAGTSIVSTNSSSVAAVPFPGAFPTGLVTVVATSGDASTTTKQVIIAGSSVSQFTVQCLTGSGAGVGAGTNNVRINWFALGW